MNELVYRFLRNDLSRRGFIQALTALGLTGTVAESTANAAAAAANADADSGSRRAQGTGGELMVEQMAAAGVRFLFTNPGSFEVGFFDAFLDRPGMQLIMGLHEGIVISMADGYHKASGEPALVNVPRDRGHRAVRRPALQLEPGRLRPDRHRRPARQRDAGRQPAAGAQARLRPEGREPSVHEDVLGDPRPRLDPGDAPPRLQGGDDRARRPDLPRTGQPRPGGQGSQRRDPRPRLLHHPGRHSGPGRGHRGGCPDADRGRGADHSRRRRGQQGQRAAGGAGAGRAAAGTRRRRELAVPQLPAHASAVCRRLQQPRPRLRAAHRRRRHRRHRRRRAPTPRARRTPGSA